LMRIKSIALRHSAAYALARTFRERGAAIGVRALVECRNFARELRTTHGEEFFHVCSARNLRPPLLVA
jgi:hypothetical protein